MYTWKHRPIKLVEDADPQDTDVCVQDDLNQSAVLMTALEIPAGDWDRYGLNHERVGRARDRQLADEDPEDLEVVYGFFISGDTSGYGGGDRNPLEDPAPQDVFVSMNDGVYLPVGQHSQGSHHPGDYLISAEDYLAISAGLYTPETYVCPHVRTNDPHQSIRNS